MLRKERICDIILPRLQVRWLCSSDRQDRYAMELNGEIEPRVSLVDQEDDVEEQAPAPFLEPEPEPKPAPAVPEAGVEGADKKASGDVAASERARSRSPSRRDRCGTSIHP